MALLAIGYIGFTVVGLWSLALCIGVINHAFGYVGLIVSLFIAPIALALAPIYAGVVYGDWRILVIEYGGLVVATALSLLGKWLGQFDLD